MYFCEYTKEEKTAVAKQLKSYSFEQCICDYQKLVSAYNSGKLDEIKPLSLVGIKFIEYFTYIELLNTKSKQGISFYDFWYNKEKYMNNYSDLEVIFPNAIIDKIEMVDTLGIVENIGVWKKITNI